MFDKSNTLFPIKDKYVFLTHCGIAPLYANALKREQEVGEAQMRSGALVYRQYDGRARMPDDIAAGTNAARFLNLIGRDRKHRSAITHTRRDDTRFL